LAQSGRDELGLSLDSRQALSGRDRLLTRAPRAKNFAFEPSGLLIALQYDCLKRTESTMHGSMEPRRTSEVATTLCIAFAMIVLAIVACAVAVGPAYDPEQALSIFAAP
jgi:hypothetical protein